MGGQVRAITHMRRPAGKPAGLALLKRPCLEFLIGLRQIRTSRLTQDLPTRKLKRALHRAGACHHWRAQLAFFITCGNGVKTRKECDFLFYEISHFEVAAVIVSSNDWNYVDTM